MQIQKIWLSPDTEKKSHYAARVLAGVLGIVLAMVAIVCGGSFLIFAFDLPRELFSLLLTCGVTALAVILSLRLGWRSVQNATMFFLTEDDRMFVLDARELSGHGRDLIGYAKDAAKTQRFLRSIAQSPYLPAGADELLWVKRIHENRSYYSAVCRVRRKDGRIAQRTYFVVKGYEDEQSLLVQLERRQETDGVPELTVSKMPLFILISALSCAVLIALCVCSHPSVGMLPGEIYFPCLAAVVVAVFFVSYFALRYRRGE